MSRACTTKYFMVTRVKCLTHLRPDATDLSNLLHIGACYDNSIPGACCLLFFASKVQFDPWGLHARHAATLPPWGPTGL